jgi:hypothetical protein
MDLDAVGSAQERAELLTNIAICWKLAGDALYAIEMLERM